MAVMRNLGKAPPDSPLCPLCSAAPFCCDHGVLRWSHLGFDYEESGLERMARAFEETVNDRLVVAWERAVPPEDPVLRQAYEEGIQELGEEWDPEDALYEVSDLLHEYVTETLRTLPGVVVEDDGTTMIFYSVDRDRVWNALDDRIRALEIEMDRHEKDGEVPGVK